MNNHKKNTISAEFQDTLDLIKKARPDIDVYEEARFDEGDHPINFVDFECAFTATHLSSVKPSRLLDIGSYRHFILGLLGSYEVTTVDVRQREPMTPLENAVTCDAASLPFSDGYFDAVTSLCAIEHFGLGRYGDKFDIDGDIKTFSEMKRVLGRGGYLIFTTTFNSEYPAVAFNAHRIYNHAQIKTLCGGFIPIEEKIYSHRYKEFRPLSDAVNTPQGWDVYCGCWRKTGMT